MPESTLKSDKDSLLKSAVDEIRINPSSPDTGKDSYLNKNKTS